MYICSLLYKKNHPCSLLNNPVSLGSLIDTCVLNRHLHVSSVFFCSRGNKALASRALYVYNNHLLFVIYKARKISAGELNIPNLRNEKTFLNWALSCEKPTKTIALL